MESWLPTIIASSVASLITGFFTWKAAISAQKRAAEVEKQNREIDQAIAENKVQLRAIADYFQEVDQLRKEWRRQSEYELSNPGKHVFDSHAAKAALELRHQYLTDLRNATRSLDLYLYHEQLSNNVVKIIEIVGNAFTESKKDFRQFSGSEVKSDFKEIHRRVLKNHDTTFDPRLDEELNSLYSLSREQLGFQKKEKGGGLFT